MLTTISAGRERPSLSIPVKSCTIDSTTFWRMMVRCAISSFFEYPFKWMILKGTRVVRVAIPSSILQLLQQRCLSGLSRPEQKKLHRLLLRFLVAYQLLVDLPTYRFGIHGRRCWSLLGDRRKRHGDGDIGDFALLRICRFAPNSLCAVAHPKQID